MKVRKPVSLLIGLNVVAGCTATAGLAAYVAFGGCTLRDMDLADGSVTAHLSVWFPSTYDIAGEPPAKPTEYGLEVTASHDGSAWC